MSSMSATELKAAHETLDILRVDFESAGFTVKKFKSIYGWPSGCLQVMPGYLLPSIFIFVDGTKLLFSRFMNLYKMRNKPGGLHCMELSEPGAKPGELLLRLFQADAELKERLKTYE